MSFAKQAADELFPEPAEQAGLDPEAVKAKKDHWKKWLAALGILGGVGAGAYLYNRQGANGQTLGRTALKSLGLAGGEDTGANTRSNIGLGVGLAAPDLAKIPAIRTALHPNTTLRGLAESAKTIARPVSTEGESVANQELRQLNQSLGGTAKNPGEKLREILESHTNQPNNTSATSNPLTDAGRLRALVEQKQYVPPVPLKAGAGLIEKIMTWNKGRKDADRAVSDLEWTQQHPEAQSGNLSAKGVRESLPKGVEPGRFARDIQSARSTPIFKNTFGAKGLGARALLGLGGSYVGRNLFAPSSTDL